MTFTFDEWRQIDGRIKELIKESHGPYFTQGVVIKNDTLRKLVWLDEFGDQPIPMFTFDYNVQYYDTQASGLVSKVAEVTPICPNVGDIVLVARQHGSRRLPKCLGILRSRDFIIPSDM